ncbi:translation initiation factor eIF 4e-like domain-containing protein [Pseudomassariella vexata]|uniref:Translation initiation factor eIF 4e-like domain-containing protein n=1 Tax=Pseudomassariella vexata TaxID=1141098 RepID=A0A1Y2EJ61_9PEZI|nr:translation initiation factor eIF 4e-like domain-containing protein [Pseudomassariella vexata]ORY71601.1 translation initiation factor eIF 4e-like domain-containing protein [Pseudomassariella vexata]
MSPSVSSPAEQRDDAKRKFMKTMRALPTQHYWNYYFDRPPKEQKKTEDGSYQSSLEQLGSQIESIQDFWRHDNNLPLAQMQMRESIYLFKSGFKPIWEDRRNVLGGSWTFRAPKTVGPKLFSLIQAMAIGEQLQEVVEEGDTICGVGLSVRFNSHLISIWHRDASKKKSIDALLQYVLNNLPADLGWEPKPDNYFYKKHSDHTGFKAPAELQAVLDSQKKAEAAAAAKEANEKKENAKAPEPAEAEA